MSFVKEISLPNGHKYTQPTGLFINNEFVAAKSGKKFQSISPSTEEVICEVEEAGAEDVAAAVAAASEAFKTWKESDPTLRTNLLLKLADLFEQHKETLAEIESLDNGKSLFCAKYDVNLVINYIRSTAGWADKVDGRTIETGKEHFTYTRREPLGVVGQIIPWNFPLLMWSWKIAPAVATGNCCVLKPASPTPLSALYAAQLVKEAGFPAGVVNIIPGSGRKCGNAIIEHPKVKKIAFTGSTDVGIDIAINSAKNGLKKVTLELGGKSPNIVFNDCDVAKTVQNLIVGIFFNSGEVCCAGSRIYIQSGIYDKVLSAFKEEVEKIKVGNPFEEGVFQGAQTTEDQYQTVMSYIASGKEQGAKVLTGGVRCGNKGFFVKPTIFVDVKEDMKIVKEEIFGPVVTISKFDTVKEVVDMANDSNFGLAAGIHTKDVNKALAVSKLIEAGSVWVNTYNDFHQNVPFGGYKESGIGREMGSEALDNYTQIKAVRVKLDLSEVEA